MKKLYLLCMAILLPLFPAMGQGTPQAFITTWSVEAPSTLTIPLNPSFAYNFQYTWGKDNGTAIASGSHTSAEGNFRTTFTEPGTYRLSITGAFPHFYNYPKAQLLDVEQWGTIPWKSMRESFREWPGTSFSATDTPNLSQANDISRMFTNASSFNQDLNQWDVGNIIFMRGVFYGASSFNGNLSSWNVTKVTKMKAMFNYASSFNQDLSAWNVGNVTEMTYMFNGTSSFNQDIGNWNTGKVTSMEKMFCGASIFNQDLSYWTINNVGYMRKMFDKSGLSTTNYDRILTGWAAQDVQTGVSLGAEGITYCTGEAAWEKLITQKGWAITDGGKNCTANIAFITTWNAGSSENITIPLNPQFTYNFQYTWAKDNGTVVASGSHTSTMGDFVTKFAETGIYRLSITGEFPHFVNYHEGQLLDVEQWGAISWKSMKESFKYWIGVTFSAQDVPNLSQVTDMSEMFAYASGFNQDIGNWDVSNVTTMSQMFKNAYAFRGNIESWDVSNVISMKEMFARAEFNGDIGSWNVSNVTDMSWMFSRADEFNGDIGSWNVSNVTTMSSMFENADAFNQDIGGWNVSNVTDMGSMFRSADAFNQDIRSWNVGNVTSMFRMFRDASVFNQNIGSWNVSNVTRMANIFSSSGLSTESYDRILTGWAAQDVQTGVWLRAIGITYCTATAARDQLIKEKGWDIDDGGQSCALRSRSAKAVENNTENGQEESTWRVYPNPVTDILHLGNTTEKTVTLSLTDIQGRVIRNTKKRGTDITMNVNALPPGFYILTVQDGETTTTKKIIKNR